MNMETFREAKDIESRIDSLYTAKAVAVSALDMVNMLDDSTSDKDYSLSLKMKSGNDTPTEVHIGNLSRISANLRAMLTNTINDYNKEIEALNLKFSKL